MTTQHRKCTACKTTLQGSAGRDQTARDQEGHDPYRDGDVSPEASSEAVIAGLYVHVPFCGHKCGYCDFYSRVDRDRHGPFVAALEAELQHRCQRHSVTPGTLFVGGGTPTVLAPSLWGRLFGRLARLGVGRRLREFTVEANPETVTGGLMDMLVSGGVNRLSIGAQSTHPDLLATLDRHHAADAVARAVGIARDAGIGNLSLDYIFAIPGQTMAMLAADLDAALALEPEHLSFYELTCEPETELARRVANGSIRLAAAELQAEMYEYVMARLDAAGYEHYEISNWARRPTVGDRGSTIEDYRCGHNLVYWRNENWLGLGPSAASHVEGLRWRNAPDLDRYLQQPGNPPTADREQLADERRIGEELMLGLRLRQGVPEDWLAKRLRADDPRRQTIAELIEMGMLERTATHLRLTARGLLVADTVIGKLL